MLPWKEKVRPTYRIVPMDKSHVREAEALVIESLKLTQADLDEFGAESPAGCFAAYLRNKTIHGKGENRPWSRAAKNDPDSLKYYVALDRHNRVVGVSGIYHALPGYSQKIGASRVCSELENGHTFWLGWYGVEESSRGRGIGTDLLRASVREAVHRAGPDLSNYRYAIYADAGAIDFYKKLGFEKVATVHEIHAVMRAPLEDIAVKLGVSLKGHIRRAAQQRAQESEEAAR